jgi:hypothetical protein
MANDLYGTSGADSLTGTAADEDIWAYGGADTINPGAGEDRVYGGLGDDTYIITDRWDLLYEAGGKDTALVYADFVKYAEGIENWVLQPGVKALPYWIDALVTEEAIYAQRWLEPGRSFYVAFPKEPPSYLTSSDRNSWSALNDKQIAAVRSALKYLESVTGLVFVETDDVMKPNVIALSNNKQSGSAAYAYFPDDAYWGSDLFFSDTKLNLDARTNSYFALTLMHELGHTLGLKHPFDDSNAGEIAVGPFLDIREENTQWTVMSYNEWPPYGLSLAPFDIAALQYLYGPNPKVRAGDDRYILTGGATQMIWDGGGRDVLDGSALRQPMHVSLEEGVWSWIGEKQGFFISQEGQVTININSLIEDLLGGSSNDWLEGNRYDNSIDGGAGNDSLQGGAGRDRLVGGEGFDWAIFSLPRAKASLSLTSPNSPAFDQSAQTTSSWELRVGDELDQLQSIERIAFSDAAVALDLDGRAGDAYQLLALLFGKAALTPQNIGLALYLCDEGFSWQQLVSMATASQVYLQQHATANPSAIGSAVWTHLTGAAPDQTAKSLIDQTQAAFGGDVAAWLAWLSGLPLVQSLTGLDDLQLVGIDYQPWGHWPGG